MLEDLFHFIIFPGFTMEFINVHLPTRDTKNVFLSRFSYEFIPLSLLLRKRSEIKPFTAFACLFRSHVSAMESEMNEWKSTEISIPSETEQKNETKTRIRQRL